MHWQVLLVTALVMGSIDAANAQSVADTLTRFGLIGEWANDCSLPASTNNFRTTYAIGRSGSASRTYYDKPGHVYSSFQILYAKVQTPGEIWYVQVSDNQKNKAEDRMEIVLNLVGDKYQVVSSKRNDGSFAVENRKFTSNGTESPWQVRCSGK